MQSRSTPSKEQAAHIRAAGLDPNEYTVINELCFTMFIRHRASGAVKMISKCP